MTSSRSVPFTSTGGLRCSRPLLALLLVLMTLPACAGQPKPTGIQGAYRFDDGDLVSIRRSIDKTFRARFFDSGRSHRLHPAGELRFTAGTEFSNAEPVEATVEFQRGGGGQIEQLLWKSEALAPRTARRINRSEDVVFESDGVVLAGRLDLPDSDRFAKPIAAVALIHGSGSDAATEYFYSGDFLAAHGIATLIYDKRGTGRSQGEYTFDFYQLAKDAEAAIGFLDSHPALSDVSLGLMGYSQGGWIAPLAASKERRVEFVVVSYGLVASPAEEARVETRRLLRSRGVADEHLDELDRLTKASVAVIASGFEDGWEELGRLKRKCRNAPWASELRGTTVGRFLRFPNWLIRLLGPRLAPKDLPWYYDSKEVLRDLAIPTVWLLAEEDTSAPIELSLPMLERLKEEGRPVEIKVFPDADHAMITLPKGYAPGYFEAEIKAVRRLAEHELMFEN